MLMSLQEKSSHNSVCEGGNELVKEYFLEKFRDMSSNFFFYFSKPSDLGKRLFNLA